MSAIDRLISGYRFTQTALSRTLAIPSQRPWLFRFDAVHGEFFFRHLFFVSEVLEGFNRTSHIFSLFVSPCGCISLCPALLSHLLFLLNVFLVVCLFLPLFLFLSLHVSLSFPSSVYRSTARITTVGLDWAKTPPKTLSRRPSAS